MYVEKVHRLSNLGTVFTWIGNGASHEGFVAEWRGVELMMVDGEVLSRAEIFDENDLDVAIARFEQLNRPAPRMENAASRAYERLQERFAVRDWEALAAALDERCYTDDRRRVVGAGVRRGPDAAIEDSRAIADVGFTTLSMTVIATRAERLALVRAHYSGIDHGPEAFYGESLQIVEIDPEDTIVAIVVLDLDDIDAAFAELDARYLAGEGAAYQDTWSVIVRARAALARHELPPTTPDWVNLDHRRGIGFTPGGMTAWIRATWNLQHFSTYIEAVHRLNNRGAVFTQVASGRSQEGFDAEWRILEMITSKGDLVDHAEFFEETDVDVALARFDELSGLAPRLENAATETWSVLTDAFNRRDMAGFLTLTSADAHFEDRRKGLRDSLDGTALPNLVRALFETAPSSWHVRVEPIAIRGSRLSLTREVFRDTEDAARPIVIEIVRVTEVTDSGLVQGTVLFDSDDIAAAFEELDARYLLGEAAAHAHTWSVIAGALAGVNRHEIPETTPGWVNIDHRRAIAFAPGDMAAYVRATWDEGPDGRAQIEAVHRLSDVGAVVTQVGHEISPHGFEAEWRLLMLLTVEGDRFNRCELFDEGDHDAALARFDEFGGLAARLENATSQAVERFLAHFVAGDWDALAETIADDFSHVDGRRLVGSGLRQGREATVTDMRAMADLGITDVTSTVIATRGEGLALMSARFTGRDQGSSAFLWEVLVVGQSKPGNRLAAGVVFDPDDIDAAFAELDARYIAGEGAKHARVWSVVAESCAAMNRLEFPSTTPRWVNLDHRRATPFAPNDLTAVIKTANDLTPDLKTHHETVHHLSDFGAVVTQVSRGTSHDGFHAEWRFINLLSVEGDLIDRIELFDEADLGAALARFDELSGAAATAPPAPPAPPAAC